jgi:phosphohistidine phosphatase
MKQLFLIRHAKSEWDFAGITDFDRPLSTRGHHDAPKMAQLFSSLFPKIDLILSSSAQRAFSTAQYFAKELHIDVDTIVQKNSLYHASQKTISDYIKKIDDKNSIVCIFGHNPGLSDLVSSFLKEYLFAEVPTCGIVKLTLYGEHWKDFSTNNVTLEKYWFPKEILEEYKDTKS